MGVKGIFKVLIATPLIMVTFAFIVEIYNLNTTGMQINSINKLAARQSCVLFSQESYKGRDGGGSVNMSDIMCPDGGVYVTGKFYLQSTAEDVYHALYGGSEFASWLNNPAVVKGDWYSLKVIKKAVDGDPSMNMAFPGWDASPETMRRYSEGQMAKMYKDALVTPLNMGVPYIDLDTANRMFRWNLTQLLSNCDNANIHRDESGNPFVMFKGYRVYVTDARITSLDYKTFDLENGADVAAFESYVHMDSDKIMDASQLDASLGTEWGMAPTDERHRVCVVGVNYSVPITYEGVTPIKKIFEYAWSNEVEGYHGNGQITGNQRYNYDREAITSGGFSGNNANASSLPVPGTLMYYIVR